MCRPSSAISIAAFKEQFQQPMLMPPRLARADPTPSMPTKWATAHSNKTLATE